MPDPLLVAGVLFAATLVRAVFGFGDALLAMPLLALALGVRVATPVVGLLSIVIAAGLVATTWRSAELRSVTRLVIASMLGVPVGLVLLTGLPEKVVVRGLGALLVGYAGWRLLAGPSRRPAVGPGWAVPFGLAAGGLGAAYNTSGPAVVVYSTLRRLDPAAFRATFNAWSVPSSLVVAGAQGAAGLWSGRVFGLAAAGLPAVGAALLVGPALRRRLPAHRFARAVDVLVGLLGLALLA